MFKLKLLFRLKRRDDKWGTVYGTNNPVTYVSGIAMSLPLDPTSKTLWQALVSPAVASKIYFLFLLLFKSHRDCISYLIFKLLFRVISALRNIHEFHSHNQKCLKNFEYELSEGLTDESLGPEHDETCLEHNFQNYVQE